MDELQLKFPHIFENEFNVRSIYRKDTLGESTVYVFHDQFYRLDVIVYENGIYKILDKRKNEFWETLVSLSKK